jgi:replicative superfamily II helicase
METIYDYVFKHEVLNKAIEELMLKQFLQESLGIPQVVDYFENETFELKMSKASLLASVLACSSVVEHQQKALSFAVLSYLNKKDTQYASFCYIILSRLHNIQQGSHLRELLDKDQFKINFDEELNLELSVNRALSALNIPGSSKRIYLNEFQRLIWSALEQQHRLIAISGPTSAGKSFMVQNHIVKMCKEKPSFHALYIVPTRALIAEVSSELRNRLHDEEISIRVAVGHVEETNERSILVVTPERCLQLLRKKENRGSIDFIFIDEIQKVEDPERGVTLEHVLWELLQIYPVAQVVLAGPYLKNLKKTMVDLCGLQGEPIESKFTPVYQLKTIFTLSSIEPNKIGITIKGEKGLTVNTSVPSEISLYAAMKKSQPKTIAYLVYKYGNDSRNIIYAPTRRIAERFALALADLMPQEAINSASKTKQRRIAELIGFLKKEIHPDCALIKSLKKGVAFHHGLMPEMAKLEVEELYRTGAIENLVCTTTLLEGVNLPADKLFIYRPWKRDKDNILNGFDFGNLIGRAGRIKSSLNGSVYCIELEDEPWAKEKLDADPVKEVIPATSKATDVGKKEILFANLTKLSTEMLGIERSIVCTIVFLRQKALKSTEQLVAYLKSKNLSPVEIEIIRGKIEYSLRDRIIPEKFYRM